MRHATLQPLLVMRTEYALSLVTPLMMPQLSSESRDAGIKLIPTGLPSILKQDMHGIVGPGSRIFQKLFFLMVFRVGSEVPQKLVP